MARPPDAIHMYLPESYVYAPELALGFRTSIALHRNVGVKNYRLTTELPLEAGLMICSTGEATKPCSAIAMV